MTQGRSYLYARCARRNLKKSRGKNKIKKRKVKKKKLNEFNSRKKTHTNKKNTSACLCSILKKGTIYTSTEGASPSVKPLWQTAVKKKYSLPSEQIFLSCMAFSVYEIVRLACQSRSWFVLYAQGPIAKIEFSNSYTSSFVSTAIHYPKRIGGGGGSDIT